MCHDILFYLAEFRIPAQPLWLVLDQYRASDRARLYLIDFGKRPELRPDLLLQPRIIHEIPAVQAHPARNVSRNLHRTDEDIQRIRRYLQTVKYTQNLTSFCLVLPVYTKRLPMLAVSIPLKGKISSFWLPEQR